jgi:hypothetical protein
MLIAAVVQACTLGSLLVAGGEFIATISAFVLHLLVNGHNEFSEKEGVRVFADLGIVKNREFLIVTKVGNYFKQSVACGV